jgi:hypothetical protein
MNPLYGKFSVSRFIICFSFEHCITLSFSESKQDAVDYSTSKEFYDLLAYYIQLAQKSSETGRPEQPNEGEQ